MRFFVTVIVICVVMIRPVAAQDWAVPGHWKHIGDSSMFTNDFLGDGRDRWRTGSFTYSHLRGLGHRDGVLRGFGEILEFRFRSDVFTPSGGSQFPGDRPYAGAASLAILTHWQEGPALFAFGVEGTAIGPQTGLTKIQRDFHKRYSLPQPPFVGQELGDQWALGLSVEAATKARLTGRLGVRGFLDMQAGAETLARAGADLRLSAFGHDDLMLRDVVTGQLHSAREEVAKGWAITAGGDVAYVTQSLFLPDDRVAGIKPVRYRGRAGIEYRFSGSAALFYGATYLSPEFEGQSEGQTLGSLRLNFSF